MQANRLALAGLLLVFIATAMRAGAEPPAAALRHDPQFILEAVARRMGITLQPDVPRPKLLLESETPRSRVLAAAERQWGLQLPAFASFYAAAGNEIYLIDDAALYQRRRGTLDDALAHEFVHYLQVAYRGDFPKTDWLEYEAVEVQLWFRREYMEPSLAKLALAPPRAQPAPPDASSSDTAASATPNAAQERALASR